MNKPRRILCVTSTYPRWKGDSTPLFVHHLAKDLQDSGWQVDVIAPHSEGAKKFETLDGINVYRFRYAWPATWQTVCYQGGSLINIRNNPLNLFKIPMLIIAEFFMIFKRLMFGNYDLLHTHWLLPQGFNGVLAAKLFGIPHVSTVHGGDVFALNSPILKAFKKLTIRQATAITVNSSATLQAVMKLYSSASHVHQIPMGITIHSHDNTHEEAQHIRDNYKKGNDPLIIFVGRLIEEKGLHDLLLAVSMLQKSYPDIQLMVVGSGQDESHFKQLSDELQISSSVHWPGWIDSNLVHNYLAAADIFIGPSIQHKSGWKEAQGLVFLESMAAKTPVITTSVGGITDIIQHQKTGLIVDQNSPEEIAKATTQLFENKKLMASITDSAYQYATSSFSREFSAKQFSKLFLSVLD